MGIVERIWYGRDATAESGRALLWPLSRLYDAGVTARNLLYETGMLRSAEPSVPVISVGNLTVGGTGKTPFAAWLVERLSRQHRPAILLRGYGADEPEVHRRLNPGALVVVNADRVAGVADARARGADVVVLDDGFQHRRLARRADIVLLSAEQLSRPRRQLPAGPWREPLEAARRADLLVITRKSAATEDLARVVALVRGVVPSVPLAQVLLGPVRLVDAADQTPGSLERLRGASVLAVTAIGEPEIFAQQLRQLGAVVSLRAYRDHHEFTDAEIAEAAAQVPADGFAVCTLKDAVKLAHRWPRHRRLWYVSQHLVVEQGADDLDRVIQRALTPRTTTTITAG